MHHGDGTNTPLLAISALNQLLYCARRFWYIHVCGEMLINVPVLEGQLLHQVHHSGVTWRGERRVYGGIVVSSERLGLIGVCDWVEEYPAGELMVIEHKRGRRGHWENDEVQIAALALCLEETSGKPVREAILYYRRSNRRQKVDLTPELRERVEKTAQEAWGIIENGQIPARTSHRARCRGCSLRPLCMPELEVGRGD